MFHLFLVGKAQGLLPVRGFLDHWGQAWDPTVQGGGAYLQWEAGAVRAVDLQTWSFWCRCGKVCL